QANGYAGLDAFGKVPLEQLPEDGSFQGNWDASTNTPTLTAGVGIPGQEYYVKAGGAQSITGPPVDSAEGATITFSAGNVWTHQPNPDRPAIALKLDKSTVVTAGTGLDGGGELDGGIELELDAATIASLAKADTAMQSGAFGIGGISPDDPDDID